MAGTEDRDAEKELDRLRGEVAQDIDQRVVRDPKTRLEREGRILELERRVCAARGEEFAEDLGLSFQLEYEWYAVLGFTMEPFLVCPLAEPHGQARNVVFQFTESVESRFGGLNDEVLEAHPLWGRGLAVSGFFVVKNSGWQQQLATAMRSHPNYDPNLWSRLKHYLFRGKEGDFACLASGFRTSYSTETAVELRERLGNPISLLNLQPGLED